MRKRIVFLVLAFLLPGLMGQPPLLAAASLPRVVIGMVLDGPSPWNKETVARYRREAGDLMEGEFDLRFPAAKTLVADWTPGKVQADLDRLLADPEIDMVLALGVLASRAAIQRRTLPKPVLAPFVLALEAKDILAKKGVSGKKNLSFVTMPLPALRDLRVFHDLVAFSHLAFLVNRPYLDAIPALRREISRQARELGFTVAFIPVDASAGTALAALPAEIDAVYVASLPRLTPEEFKRLATGLTARRLPSFSQRGYNEVEQGILAGVATASARQRLARRAALNMQSILSGQSAGSLPVALSQDQQLSINMATALAIGYYPRWDILNEARLVHEKPGQSGPRLSLAAAVHKAVAANLDLGAQRWAVTAGVQDVRRARSALLPQLGVSASETVIDRDRAEASAGALAQRTLSDSATLNQLIYSDSAWAEFAIQGHIQTTRENDREQLRLDIIQQTAAAYLAVLRAKTLRRISRDNLGLTRSNLELARVRQAVGISGPAEVYRWESKIATDRQLLIQADARLKQAKISLNRLLHRPSEESFTTEEVGLDDPILLTSHQRVYRYIDNPWSFKVFRDFMVQEGLSLAPELARAEAEMAAQQRRIVAAKRAFWVPDLSLNADAEHILDRGGAGSDSTAGAPNDTDWTVGLKLSLPLFSGGGRRADLAKAHAELSRLRLERASTAEKVEQRIRTALERAYAAFAGIRLSKEAAAAAGKNLQLVTDSYARGVVSILDLLDAQNAALVAGLRAANADYNFLTDLMQVERSVGRFDFFTSKEERETWFKQLDAYAAKAGLSPADAKQ